MLTERNRRLTQLQHGCLSYLITSPYLANLWALCFLRRAFDPLQVSREQPSAPILGQRIDTVTGEVERLETGEPTAAGAQSSSEAAHREAVAKFVSELRTKPPAEVVAVFRAAQAQRVSAYGQFDASLAAMLEAGTLEAYGGACATATAAFANCSANAAAAAVALQGAGALEPARIITKVQVGLASKFAGLLLR